MTSAVHARISSAAGPCGSVSSAVSPRRAAFAYSCRLRIAVWNDSLCQFLEHFVSQGGVQDKPVHQKAGHQVRLYGRALVDDFLHIPGRPDIERRGLHGDNDQVARDDSRSGRSCGRAGCQLAVQGLLGQADDREARWRAFDLALRRPVERRALRIGID